MLNMDMVVDSLAFEREIYDMERMLYLISLGELAGIESIVKPKKLKEKNTLAIGEYFYLEKPRGGMGMMLKKYMLNDKVVGGVRIIRSHIITGPYWTVDEVWEGDGKDFLKSEVVGDLLVYPFNYGLKRIEKDLSYLIPVDNKGLVDIEDGTNFVVNKRKEYVKNFRDDFNRLYTRTDKLLKIDFDKNFSVDKITYKSFINNFEFDIEKRGKEIVMYLYGDDYKIFFDDVTKSLYTCDLRKISSIYEKVDKKIEKSLKNYIKKDFEGNVIISPEFRNRPRFADAMDYIDSDVYSGGKIALVGKIYNVEDNKVESTDRYYGFIINR